MKLLLLIVSILAVNAVDGQVLLGELADQNLAALPTEDSIDENDDYDFYSNQTGYIVPRGGGSRCKAKNVCIIMGGSCVTNTTLCGGRLVPGCKGENCQCCVNGTLETEVSNIEQRLQTMQVNLTNANSNLNSNLHSLTDANSNLNTKLQNLTEVYLDLNVEFQSLRKDLTYTISTIVHKLTYLIMKGCPEGFFQTEGSSQCYKYIYDMERDWASAKQKCLDEGLVLAEPTNPVSLRKYIAENYNTFGWIGARGTGSYYRWERSGQQISNNDPLWANGHPGIYVSTGSCLTLLSQKSYWLATFPNQPFFAHNCKATMHTICEYLMK